MVKTFSTPTLTMRSILFVFALFLTGPLANAQNPTYPGLNMSDWPLDVVERLRKEIPEINDKTQDDIKINQILKKLDKKLQFNGLRVVKIKDELRLVGEISAQIDRIEFEGLTDLSEQDALSLLNLNIKAPIDDETLKAALDRLTQHYRSLGYRFAEVKSEIKSISTLKRFIVVTVVPKKQTQLKSVKVEGIDEISKQEIEAQLQILFFNPVLDQETLNRTNTALRKLLSQRGYFLTPVPAPQILFSADELSARLLFKLKKTNPYGIEILNAKEISKPKLEQEVLGLDTFTTKEVNFGSEMVEKLKAFYIAEGYPHIDIAYYERKDGQKITLIFNLDEGPYTHLNQLSFVGQLSRPESYYKNLFDRLSSAKTQSGAYIKEDIEETARNLVTLLQNEGFVNARLGRLQVATDREKPKLGFAIIQIDEGPQITINSIRWVGANSIKPEILNKVIELNEGQPLSLIQLEVALGKLKSHYNNLGFIEYKLLNDQKDLITYSEKNSRADLKFEIAEGPKVEVQSILLEGNVVTHDKVILIELEFKSGDALNPAKIEESISRLQRTGHFSSIEISTLEANTNIAQRTVLVKVTERDSGLGTVGVGATNENNGTLRGYAGLANRNWGGWGRGWSIRGEGNYNFADVKFLESKVIFGFVAPYLLESRARIRANATRSTAISDIAIRKVTEINSGVISIEQDFTSHVTASWDIPSVATYIDYGITREDEIQFGYSRESLVIGSTGPNIDIDYRDNLFNPTKGSYTRLSLEYASDTFSSNRVDDFVRSTAQSTWYVPFDLGRVVFAQYFGAGHVQNINRKGFGIPFDKKGFTLGGRTTIRGFGSLEYFPSPQLNSSQSIGPSYKLNGFASYQLIKSELRFPLWSKYDIMGAFFYDGGQVIISEIDFSDKWRDSMGVGLRYITPVGPLSLEYAQKLDRKEGESEGAFHLSIGVF